MLVEIFQYKIHKNLPIGNQVVICGQTDRHAKLILHFEGVFLSATSSTLLL